MNNLLQRLVRTVAVVALGTAGTVLVPPSAHAVTIDNTVSRTTSLRGCSGTGCPADVRTVRAGLEVVDFCAIGTSDLIYTGPLDGRGGFVPRADLADTSQRGDCRSSGIGGTTNSRFTLRACASNNCTSFGAVNSADPVGGFCTLTGDIVNGSNLWVLVYANSAGRGGFAPASALSGIGRLSSCNNVF